MVDKIRLFDSLLNVGRNPAPQAAQPHWMSFAFRGNREVGAGGMTCMKICKLVDEHKRYIIADC